jgi:hypothetical protein
VNEMTRLHGMCRARHRKLWYASLFGNKYMLYFELWEVWWWASVYVNEDVMVYTEPAGCDGTCSWYNVLMPPCLEYHLSCILFVPNLMFQIFTFIILFTSQVVTFFIAFALDILTLNWCRIACFNSQTSPQWLQQHLKENPDMQTTRTNEIMQEELKALVLRLQSDAYGNVTCVRHFTRVENVEVARTTQRSGGNYNVSDSHPQTVHGIKVCLV